MRARTKGWVAKMATAHRLAKAESENARFREENEMLWVRANMNMEKCEALRVENERLRGLNQRLRQEWDEARRVTAGYRLKEAIEEWEEGK